MTVEAIVREVQLATDEPFRYRRVAPVEDLGPGFEPFELAGDFAPEFFRIPVGFGVEALVLFDGWNVRLFGKRRFSFRLD